MTFSGCPHQRRHKVHVSTFNVRPTRHLISSTRYNEVKNLAREIYIKLSCINNACRPDFCILTQHFYMHVCVHGLLWQKNHFLNLRLKKSFPASEFSEFCDFFANSYLSVFFSCNMICLVSSAKTSKKSASTAFVSRCLLQPPLKFW